MSRRQRRRAAREGDSRRYWGMDAGCKKLTCELLEGRFLLSGLAEFLNPPAFYPAPSDLNHPDPAPAAVADTQERRDLIYLAQNVPTAEFPVLAQVDTPLLLLYSRALQGSMQPVGQTTIYGTPYAALFSTDGTRPHVQAFVESAPVARSALEALGMQVTAVTATADWQVVAGYLPVDAIGDAAHLAGLGVLQASERGTTDAQGLASNQWETVSYADQLKRVLTSVDGNEANIDGRIEMGVISDSINQVGNGVADSQQSGDLPPGNRVQILDDGPAGGTDEGRAMAEVIYDIGPGFNILFHSGINSAADMAAAYDELRVAGADIITDDVSRFTEPVFQDGQIAEAIDSVYLDHDVLVFGAVGNRNRQGYNAIWRDDDGDGFHEFADGDETINITLANGEKLRVYLQWSQFWAFGTTDIDIQLFNANLSTLLVDSNVDNNPPFLGVGDFGFGTPLETLTYTNNTGAAASYQLAFRFEDGTAPDGLTLQMFAPKDKNAGPVGVFTDPYTQNQPAITGNHAATNMFSIGAVGYRTPNVIEGFSSHGPQTLFFGAGGLGVPEVREKPDFVAVDAVDTSFFGGGDRDRSGFNDFSGTSAAAPNAAAVAGLILDAANRRLSYDELSEILAETATGTGAGAWDPIFGEGLINALGAGLVARGLRPNEVYVELNPFGDYTARGQDVLLSGDTDTDGYAFAFDADGPVAIGVSGGGSRRAPGLILWSSDSGGFVDIDYNDHGYVGDGFFDSRIQRELASWELYQAEVFEANMLGAGGENYRLKIDGPDPPITPIVLAAQGDGGARAAMENQLDTDYFTIVAPETAGNELTVVLTPQATLNGVLTLYDADGEELDRQDAAPAGQAETIVFGNVEKGATYYLRVGAGHYASAGAYDLDVDFEMALPLEMTDAEGFAYFHFDGTSHDTQTFSDLSGEADITNDMDVDSFFFAGKVTGDYTVSVTPLSGDVAPLVAVYNAATGQLLGSTATASQGTTRQLHLPLAAWQRYIVAVADDDRSGTGDVEIVIEGPQVLATTPIAIGPGGSGARVNQSLDVPEDSDFFRFTAPADADGTLAVTVSPWAGLDAAAILFDVEGRELAKSYLPGAGVDEAVRFENVTPLTTYYLTVLSKDYADQGSYDVSLEFGLIRGSIRGTKFYDLDEDGVFDEGEPGLAGWVIYVDLDGDKQLDLDEPSVETGLDGAYSLDDLPLDTHQILEVLNGGWEQTAPGAGLHNVELTIAAPAAVGLDFGNFAAPQIVGAKWNDLDGDGLRDAGEPGLAGWTIYLDLNRNGQLDPDEPAALTNQDGEYRFGGLSPREYAVAEVLQPNWVQTFPAVATERVSVDSDGNQGADASQSPAISADGRFVAFASTSANLVPDDTNDTADIFVFDRQTRTVERVSVDSAGNEGNNQSVFPAISGDGRFVAFMSTASNLVPGDTNLTWDTFVFDRQTRAMERVSIDLVGNQADGSSQELSISGDGRFVAFESLATNLVPGDTNNQFDVFVFDRQTRSTERVSVTGAGGQANGESRGPAISADGQFVAFRSVATNLVPGDTNGREDVFVFDRQTQAIQRVSVNDAGNQANADSFRPAISGDGRFVAFRSVATNLVPGDTNGRVDVFVFDRQAHSIERVSVDGAGLQANASSYDPALSADGNLVGFGSDASNLVPGDTNFRRDIFLFDRQTRSIERVSVDSVGNQGDDISAICLLSADGRAVAFNSSASNLVPGDTNGYSDIFVRSRSTTHLATVAGGPAITGLDFGNYHYSTIGGRVFNDLDGDGMYDSGEPGLDGWIVFVDVDGDGTRTAGDPWDITNAAGFFQIDGILAGAYEVRLEPPEGWSSVAPAGGFYQIAFISGLTRSDLDFAEREMLDFGDAPFPYPTLLADDGPRHRIQALRHLGAQNDPEWDGQPSPGADGDDLTADADEDGVAFLSAFTPGQDAQVRVTSSAVGVLDAWLDFNRDGDWDDAGERVFSGQTLGSGAVTLAVGVPMAAIPGPTYARFRFSQSGVASYTGPADSGEVEDYRIQIDNPYNLPLTVPPFEDYGPMSQFGDRNVALTLDSPTDHATWRFTTQAGGPATFTAIGDASSGLHPILALYNGEGDLVAVGVGSPDPSEAALSYALTPGVDEIYTLLAQDAELNTVGVVQSFFDTPSISSINTIALDAAGLGTAAGDLVTLTIPPLADVDYYQLDGVGATASEPWHRLSVKVAPLQPYRLEFQLFDGLGNPVDGRVVSPVDGQPAEQIYTGLLGGESYFVAVFPHRFEDHPVGGDYQVDVDLDSFDFGDAPASYATLSADNGPSHLIVSGFYLGSGADHEWEGQPGAAADGDDTAGNDDEDGVVFLEAMSPGHPTEIQVTASADGKLDAWIDFGGDGDFSDASDHVLTGESLVAGVNTLTIHVPIGAALGSTYARFRFSSAGGLSSNGPAGDGEVEDYAVEIVQSGEIHGTVWHDVNSDGARGSGEPGLVGRTVYLDDDNDGQFDSSSEQSVQTDSGGNFAFLDLPPGNYNVAQLLLPEGRQTFPVVVPEWVYVLETVDPGEQRPLQFPPPFPFPPVFPLFNNMRNGVEMLDFDLTSEWGIPDEEVFPAELEEGRATDIEIGPGGDVYVSVDGREEGPDRIVQFTYEMEFVRVIELPADSDQSEYSYPFGFDVLPNGNLLVAQPNSERIVELDPNGSIIEIVDLPSFHPSDVGVRSDGRFAFCEEGLLNVRPDDLMWVASDSGTVLRNVAGTVFAERRPGKEALEVSDGSLFMVGDVSLVFKFDAAGQVLEGYDAAFDPIFQWLDPDRQVYVNALAVARNEVPYGDGPVRGGAGALAAQAAFETAANPVNNGRGAWNVTVAPSQVVTGVDFGFVQVSTASGVKFNDLDGDGILDSAEPGLDGWVIWADLDDDGVRDGREPSATTSGGGLFTLEGILPGTYKIREEPQAGWAQTAPAAVYHEVQFTSGSAITGLEFGNRQLFQVFVVNSTADPGDGTPNAAELTLREAITAANAATNSLESDWIVFALPADDPGHVYYHDDGVAGQVSAAQIMTTTATTDVLLVEPDPDWPHSWFSIRPTSDLPWITDPVVIDGYSQNGSVRNINPASSLRGLSSVLKIELDDGAAPGSGLFLDSPAGGSTVRGLVINRSHGLGIVLSKGNGHVIEGNYIGTDPSGTLDLGNTAGLYVGWSGSSGNLIGGLTPAARNLISGNSGDGMRAITTGNRVQGNLIGTDRSGTRAVPNAGDAVELAANANVVGGTERGSRNILSGNGFTGVFITGSNNLVQGNFIGTDVTGRVALGNVTHGVRVASTGNVIGGSDGDDGALDDGVAARNVISANLQGGISVESATGTRVQGNYIGTDVTGTANLGNGFDTSGGRYSGITIYLSSDSLIGGTEAGAGNLIAYNAGDGVLVRSATGHTILGNSIHSNEGLGIDLGVDDDGGTPNDHGDSDTGANNLQNFPVLTSATATTSNMNVQGSLNSTPNTAFRVELFASEAADPTGFGEGQYYLGSVNVTTDAAGDASFATTVPTSLPPGRFVTATATVLRSGSAPGYGDTSEFSPDVAVTGTGAGEIRGTVWHDIDTSGSRESGEPGLAGWTIFLDEDDDLTLDSNETYTATDAGGNYAFSDLPPGNYNVAQLLAPGWHQTFPVVPPKLVYVLHRFSGVDPQVELNSVWTFDFDLNLLDTHHPEGLQEGFPTDIEIGPGGDVYVLVSGLEDGDDRIVQFTYEMEFARVIDLDDEEFLDPRGFDVLPDGSLLVAQWNNDQIVHLNPDGSTAETFPFPLEVLNDAGMTSDGDIVVCQGFGSLLNVRPDDLYWVSGNRTLLQDIAGTVFAERPASKEALEINDGSLFMVTFGGQGLRKLDVAGEVLAEFDWDPGRDVFTALAVARNEVPYGDGPVRGGAAAQGLAAASPAPKPVNTGRGVWNVVVGPGQVVQGADFGNVELSTATGVKFSDLDGDGARDAGEPGLDGWVVWADLDDDGLRDGREPSATTANGGLYTIAGILPGTYKIREEPQPGWSLTHPAAGYHEVHFLPGSMIENVDFGNRLVADFGDAPASYATLFADNGAYHALVSNVRLGNLIDPEPDGQPSRAADKDDLAGVDDEDGVVFVSPLLTGQLAMAEVMASIDGMLSAWIDFNHDGDFADDGEQVLVDKPLAAGVNQLNFGVPIWAIDGETFARFRFSTQAGLSSDGPAPDGEVEDYQVLVETLGEIHGSKWNDLDGDGLWDRDEPALPGWTIFLDADGDSELDEGELRTTTDASGNYAFTGLAPGRYIVAELRQESWVQTFPAPFIERASVTGAGNQADDESRGASISGDGRFVAFESLASNLVPGDANGAGDIFVLDRQTERVERVSVDAAGQSVNGPSFEPSISGDGRFVAFQSFATTLVPGDTNLVGDVFVFDRQTGTIQRVSVTSAGDQADGQSFEPSISGGGRYVAFGSDAANLVPGDTNGVSDVFVFDRQTGSLERVSVDGAGNEANGVSFAPSISGDGRYVAFGSLASNLVPGDTNGWVDIFVYDRQTGTIERVSVTGAGDQTNGISFAPSISGDGRYVAFGSFASNLVAGDGNTTSDIFVFDRQAGTLERVSVTGAGNEADDESRDPSISGDGRYVAFGSSATNLVSGDGNGASDIFVFDRQAGAIERVSVTGAGNQAGAPSFEPSISDDGRFVAFQSQAFNLVPWDSNNTLDIFVRATMPVHSVTLIGSEVVNHLDFGNFYRLSRIEGLKYHDLDHDGFRDPGEPGLEGWIIYVDLNDNGVHEAVEPFDTSDADGAFAFEGEIAGNLKVREEMQPGWTQTQPAQGYYDLQFLPGAVFTGLVFGNREAVDYGDAPLPYPTLAAAGGASHLIQPGFHLGSTVDDEPDGQPSAGADGDDTHAVDDEDGVRSLTLLVRGQQARIEVTASAAGMLDAWIDFSADGDWTDVGERVFSAQPLVPGANVLNILVPSWATPGNAAARFRFSPEGVPSFDGAGPVGEVEDYLVAIYELGTPLANADEYVAVENQVLLVSAPGVLANDLAVDGKDLHAELVTSTAHGVLQLLSDGSFTYTPNLNFNREDSFRYRASDGEDESDIATVTITVETDYPWCNGTNPVNVNGDEIVSPLDALLVVNTLNALGGRALATDRPRPLAPPFYDVSRDGLVSPLDALLIINHLNSVRASEAEDEGVVEPDAPVAMMWIVEDPLAGAQPEADDGVALLAPTLDEIASALWTGFPSTKALREAQLWGTRDTKWADEDLEEILAELAAGFDSELPAQWDA